MVELILLLPATSTKLIMDYSQSFSALNERLRPRITTSQQLYSSLNRLEVRQSYSLRSLPTTYRPTILPTKPEPEPEDPEEPQEDAVQEDLVSDDLEGRHCADPLPLNNSCLITELNLKDEGDEELVDEDSSTSTSKEEDTPGELTSKGTGDSSQSAAGEGGSSIQRSYVDGTLPDLIRSGRPLGRRRTLGHVSDTVGQQSLNVSLVGNRDCWWIFLT